MGQGSNGASSSGTSMTSDSGGTSAIEYPFVETRQAYCLFRSRA
jgi:hypothetical protein